MAMLIEDLLASREGEDVEFKRDASNPRSIAKEFVGFSNTAHGWIVIGIESDRTVVGLDDPQAVEERVSNSIYSSTDPQQRPQVFLTTYDDMELVIVEVPYFQGPEPLALREKGKLVVYERVGSNSMRVTDESRLEQMRRERQGQSGFDQQPLPKASMDDLDIEEIRRQFEAVGKPLDGDAKLESYDLVAKLNSKRFPTRAGLLLFGQKDFRGHVPDAYFRAIRYPGADRSGDALDSAEWREQPLLQAVDEVIAFIRRNTGVAERLEGRRRREIPHYHEGMLREILHNAVAHTDYSERGMHINLSIYSDRLELDSPGKWPASMSAEQLRRGVSKSRNRAIANMMHDLNYMEKRGTVWAKALEAERQGYPLPEWSEPGPIVRVTMRPHAASIAGEQPSRRRRDRRPEIKQVLKGGERAPSEIADAIDLSLRQVQRYLRQMATEGEIVLVGKSETDPNRRYRLP